MDLKITGIETFDVRFPTALEGVGSDSMPPDGNHSAACVVLTTNEPHLQGCGHVFTIGSGNNIAAATIGEWAARRGITNMPLSQFARDPGHFWDRMANDSQLRWLGPEKGVSHMAMGAIINALWDLWAKREGKPLWKLLCDMPPSAIVRCVPFRYISDVLTPRVAIDMLVELAPTRLDRLAHLLEHGYPAYTTSTGWLEFSTEQIEQLWHEGLAAGWRHFKIKVGRDLDSDISRCDAVRSAIGNDAVLMVDANQIWENAQQAIIWMLELAPSRPLWIEEPTSPDDILAHKQVADALHPHGIKVATGEHCHNRVMFKQLMQAGAMGFCQIDACRLGGVNEVLAVLLMAAKFEIPVCPHAGGVALCEQVQHFAAFDYVCASGSLEGRIVEYVDHLHEHSAHPAIVKDGHYRLPTAPGFSTEMRVESVERFLYPTGEVWQKLGVQTTS